MVELEVEFELSDTELDVDFGGITTVIADNPYTGEYLVVPKVAEQTVLETTNKYLAQDVTVERIPMYEASNDAGGNTLSIGEMYYG